jgi:type II secretory pathway component GspD/PulD (secretin)
MLKFMKNILTTAALFLVVNSAAFAQQPSPAAQIKPEDNYVTEKGFKSKVFTIVHRDVNNLGAVLRPLLSGFKGATIVPNGEFKTLTVRDFPENIVTIEEALKRLDTPAAPRPNIEMHMHVLLASNTSTGSANSEVPAELKDVIAQVRDTLNYRNYELVTSVLQRLTETQRGLQGSGAAQIPVGQPGAPMTSTNYEYVINSVALVPNPTGAPTIQINEFMFVLAGERIRAKVQTALNLRDGEKVVVGTSSINDRALIVVLIARLVK